MNIIEKIKKYVTLYRKKRWTHGVKKAIKDVIKRESDSVDTSYPLKIVDIVFDMFVHDNISEYNTVDRFFIQQNFNNYRNKIDHIYRLSEMLKPAIGIELTLSHSLDSNYANVIAVPAIPNWDCVKFVQWMHIDYALQMEIQPKLKACSHGVFHLSKNAVDMILMFFASLEEFKEVSTTLAGIIQSNRLVVNIYDNKDVSIEY